MKKKKSEPEQQSKRCVGQWSVVSSISLFNLGPLVWRNKGKGKGGKGGRERERERKNWKTQKKTSQHPIKRTPTCTTKRKRKFRQRKKKQSQRTGTKTATKLLFSFSLFHYSCSSFFLFFLCVFVFSLFGRKGRVCLMIKIFLLSFHFQSHFLFWKRRKKFYVCGSFLPLFLQLFKDTCSW